jgi:dihydrolipoamide dehydrogenase
MRKQGIAVNTKASLAKISEQPLILSCGVTPRVPGLHLDAAGITLNPNGGIQVDAQQRTSQAAIFAVGDCAGGPPLASYAIKQGKVAAEVIAGQRVQFAPFVTPFVVHTTPEIAMVGYTAEGAASENGQVISGRFPLAANGRALTLGTDNGVAQLVANEDGNLLGATLVGPRAGDLIGQLVLALEMGATLTDLSEILYAHPGLGEIVLEAAEQALGKVVHVVNKSS